MGRGWGAAALALVACKSSDDGKMEGADVLPTAADAAAAAAALVGGTALEAEQVFEDGFDLWEVGVDMPNGAELEVLLFRDSGELFEVEDDAGPFDYDDLDPLPGQLTYAEARATAFAEVAGELVAWEVKYDDGPYFYEFYVMEVGAQLWKIKLWAEGGEVFVVEAKEAVD